MPSMLIALYIPSWSGALAAALMQAALGAALMFALYMYAHRRHGPRRTVVVLAAGLIVALLTGLAYFVFHAGASDLPPNFTRSKLILWEVLAYFELGRSAIAGIVGVVVAWLALESSAIPRWQRTASGPA